MSLPSNNTTLIPYLLGISHRIPLHLCRIRSSVFGRGCLIVWLLALALSIAFTAHADDYVGSWSNKEDGFDTLGFALRKDGRGIFKFSVGSTVLRWERTDTGILIKIADNGKTEEMHLTFEANSQTLIMKESGTEQKRFWHVSTNEPPDLEAQMLEQQRKEQADAPSYTEHKEEFSARETLLKAVESWADRTPPNVHGLTASVQAADSSWSCTFRKLGEDYFVEMPIIDKSVDRPLGAPSTSAPSSKTPELPTRYSVPKPKADAFRKWLAEHKISFTDSKNENPGLWQTEGHREVINIELKSDKAALVSIARYLVNELFEEAKPLYRFSTYERKND